MQKPLVVAGIGGGILVALLVGALLLTSGDRAGASRSENGVVTATAGAPKTVSTAEANAWAEARATNTKGAYEVFLAAFPEGAFADEARLAMVRTETAKAEAAPAPRAVRVASNASPAPRRNVRAECQAYVDRTFPLPSKLARGGIGAAAGCGVGAMAGGDDGRNCAIGAVVGGVGGVVSAEQRNKRRASEYSACVSRGGP